MSNAQKVYQDLIIQYQSLTDEEKRAILVYNSPLFYHVNTISSVTKFNELNSAEIFGRIERKEEFINRYNSFKDKIYNPQNILVKTTYLKDIDFSSIGDFIDSIKRIYMVIEKCRTKITLSQDITVYRGIETNELRGLSKSNIVSTSIDVEKTKDFLFKNKEKSNHVFCIDLKAGTNVLITPYGLKNSYNPDLGEEYCRLNGIAPEILDLRENDQKEIIIFREDILTDEISSKAQYLNEYEIVFHDVKTEIKNKNGRIK